MGKSNTRSYSDELNIDCSVLEDYFYEGLTLAEVGKRNDIRDASARKDKYIKYKNQKGAYQRGNYCGIKVEDKSTGEVYGITRDMFDSYITKIRREYPNIHTVIDDYLEDNYGVSIVTNKSKKADNKGIEGKQLGKDTVNDYDFDRPTIINIEDDIDYDYERPDYNYYSSNTSSSGSCLLVFVRLLIIGLVIFALVSGVRKWLSGELGFRESGSYAVEQQEDGSKTLKRFTYKDDLYYGMKTLTGKPKWFCYMRRDARTIKGPSMGLIDYKTDYGLLVLGINAHIGKPSGNSIKGSGVVKSIDGVSVGSYKKGKLSGVGVRYTSGGITLVKFKAGEVVETLATYTNGLWDTQLKSDENKISHKKVFVEVTNGVCKVETGDILVTIRGTNSVEVLRGKLTVAINGNMMSLDDMAESKKGTLVGRRLELTGNHLNDKLVTEKGREIITYTSEGDMGV